MVPLDCGDVLTGTSIIPCEVRITHYKIVSLADITRALTLQRQSTFVRVHTSNSRDKNRFLIWVVGSLLSL